MIRTLRKIQLRNVYHLSTNKFAPVHLANQYSTTAVDAQKQSTPTASTTIVQQQQSPPKPPPPQPPVVEKPKTIAGIPRSALVFLSLSTVPFTLPHALPPWWFANHVFEVVSLQLNYAAILLPFLGAVQFGFAVSKYHRVNSKERTAKKDYLQYLAATIPLFIAWTALSSDDTIVQLFLLALGYLFVLVSDPVAWVMRLTPLWYIIFSTPLCVIAIASILLTYKRFVSKNREPLVLSEGDALVVVEDIVTKDSTNTSEQQQKEDDTTNL
jgi:hypothetical protein